MKHGSKNYGLVMTGGLLLALAMVTAPISAGEIAQEPLETIHAVLDPFWESTTMRGESIFFGQMKIDGALEAKLLFPPEAVTSVRSATGEITYEEGRDYAVDKEGGIIRLLPDSRIPSTTFAEMYPSEDSKLPKILNNTAVKPKTYLIFSEGGFFHNRQVAVTYTHAAGLWQGYIPKFAGASLPGTLKKLRAKEPLKLCMAGDSISVGANASKFTNVQPFQPCYGELVALGLESVYGSKVTFCNFAVGGWTSDNGLADIGKVAAEKPDLVIIGFGMNDSGKDRYAANIKAMMDKLRETSPDAEFVLVASMLSNPEWVLRGNPARFPLFRDELAKLCGQGAALADLTSVWEEFLKRKTFYDLTGNGVNHPNDFGHQLYAQVILGLLVEMKDGKK